MRHKYEIFKSDFLTYYYSIKLEQRPCQVVSRKFKNEECYHLLKTNHVNFLENTKSEKLGDKV